VPVNIILKYKSCTCTDLQIGLPAMDGQRDWLKSAQIDGVAGLAGGSGLAFAAGLAAMASRVEFSDLKVGDASAISFPAAEAGMPRLGMIRMNWRAKKLGQDTLTADVLTQEPGGPASARNFQLPFLTVHPVIVRPETLEFGELTEGKSKTVDCLIFSSTRTQFSPVVQLVGPNPADSADPCVEIGSPEPLTPAECSQISNTPDREGKKQRCVSGFRVKVTLRERVNGRQMDLGPINRRLHIIGEPGAEPIKVGMSAVIRGDIRLIGGDERDRIAMGIFRVDRGAEKSVTLVTNRTDLELKTESIDPDSLGMELEPMPASGGTKQWKLTVRVPANRAAGEIQPGSAVILQVQSTPPRRIRIPITGTAYHGAGGR
jgi:hypothetical protein